MVGFLIRWDGGLMGLLRASLLLLSSLVVMTHAYNNGVSLAPQMGWNNWNHIWNLLPALDPKS